MSDLADAVLTAVWSGAERRLRAPWRLLVVGGAVVALWNVLSVAALRVARLGTAFGPLARAGWTFLVAAVALAAAVAGLVGVVVAVDRRRLGDLGLEWSTRWAREAAVGAAAGALVAMSVVAVAAGLGLATVTGVVVDRPGTVVLAGRYLVVDAAFWLVVFVGVGLVEEVLVRGFVLVNVAEGLRGRLGEASRATVAGVLASAGLFGLLHATAPRGSLLGLGNVVVVGLVLGATVAITGRLALAVGVHVAWNATIGLGFGLPISGLDTGVALVAVDLVGPPAVTGGSFGPGGGLLATVGLAVGTAGLGWWLRGQRGLTLEAGIAEPDLRPASDRTD